MVAVSLNGVGVRAGSGVFGDMMGDFREWGDRGKGMP